MFTFKAIFVHSKFSFIVLTSFLIIGNSADGNDDVQAIWNRSMNECCEKYNITEGQVWDKWEAASSFGESDEWKGWINCWYHRIGVMENYEIKIEEEREKIKSERNKQKFDKCVNESSGMKKEDKAYVFADCVGREQKKNDEQYFPQADLPYYARIGTGEGTSKVLENIVKSCKR